ncbi:type II/IV secretion system ATPase subunit [Candidatus Woesearchaeota archaeon]|jgi:archaeal flagellar protein FlaI|nr:type II/IV secretion system ATPase subunit [Candidatus Woesearchaeota archaeon]
MDFHLWKKQKEKVVDQASQGKVVPTEQGPVVSGSQENVLPANQENVNSEAVNGAPEQIPKPTLKQTEASLNKPIGNLGSTADVNPANLTQESTQENSESEMMQESLSKEPEDVKIEQGSDDNKNLSSTELAAQTKKAYEIVKPIKKAESNSSDDSADDAEIETDLTEIKTDTFYIDLRPRLIKLPPFDNPAAINVRYPVLPPFAFIHIYWDKKENELIYEVEEPVLDKAEKELLELIILGLEEIINISYVKAAKTNLLVKYLEQNVQSILIELGAKISIDTYKKIMYYVYRNSVGFNEMEPLLNDYYVEDIECNGLHFPLYIVHRKYQNLKTTVIFNSSSYLTDFVEKLAQRSGRYISYAKPLLDGTLPDGSRVNATYTEDITTRGPTFTIRKFTKEPWTPVHLIQFKTTSPEALAFTWMAIENKFNVMTIGETASGKTTFLNAIATFIPPEARICSIEDTRELNLPHINWLPAVTRSGFGIPNVLGQQVGEITLFDLLRETFRQAPDYVIVGEVRGEETYVLFQGMASGHPSFATFHAASVPTLVKRLETPPINLSPSLVESLDLVIVCAHVKTPTRNFRRMKELDEIETVEGNLGAAKYNPLFVWDSVKDVINYNHNSVVFKKITQVTGLTDKELEMELKKRSLLLKTMADRNLSNFHSFSKVINNYYKNPKMVLKQFGIIK